MADQVIEYTNPDDAVAVELTAEHLIVTLRDRRIIHVPMEWLTWLNDATVEECFDFENRGQAIHWNALDEGISIETIIHGLPR